MIGATCVRIVGWLASPMLSRRFPKLNAAAWDAQYRHGLWDFDDVTGGAQLLNLVEEITPNARILDLACGTSATLPLNNGNHRHYHGVDISSTAIERARALGRPRTSFEVADILTYEPDEHYEAILLREVLYYFSANQTADLLRRVAGFLEADGRIYVQLSRNTRSPLTTPGQFLDVVRSCGLVLVAEGPMRKSNVGQGGSFLVLGRSEHLA